MRSLISCRGVAVLAGCLLMLPCAHAQTAQDPYWSWGWGLYGVRGQTEALDNARFDWSYVLLGNVDSTDEATLERCNEILRLNPRHRFVLRIWPIGNMGSRAENNHQATLYDYVFRPEVRRRVLAEVEREIRYFLDHLSNPERVVGATFLEELPGHFTSIAFGPEIAKWKRGDPLPWDFQPYERELNKAVGGPFDLRSPRHRRWWGRAYTDTLADINRAIRRALPGRRVLYYPHPHMRSLDDFSPAEQARALRNPEVMPYRYRDVLKPGSADGFFWYPGYVDAWKRRAEPLTRAGEPFLFGQISIPPGMRSTSLEEMTTLARSRYKRNLGAFLFASVGDPRGEQAYGGQQYGTSVELIRRFAWDHAINVDLVDQALGPRVAWVRTATSDEGSSRTTTIQAFVWNPRDSSWYGDDYRRASLHDLRVELKVAPGNVVEESGVGLAVSEPLELGPQDGRTIAWHVRGTSPDAAPVTLTATAVGTSAVVSKVEDDGLRAQSTCEEVRVARSGARWFEHGCTMHGAPRAVAVRPLRGAVQAPMLARVGKQRMMFLGEVRAGTHLVIGPGKNARLFADELFDEDARHFRPLPSREDGTVEFSQGYLVASRSATVRAKERLRVQVYGRAKEGGNCLVIVRFRGTEKEVEEKVLFVNAFGDAARTLERTLEVPSFGQQQVTMNLQFYRFEQRGTVFYGPFSVRIADIPERGIDASDQLVGSLEPRADASEVWSYLDKSVPDIWGRPRASVQFVAPAPP